MEAAGVYGEFEDMELVRYWDYRMTAFSVEFGVEGFEEVRLLIQCSMLSQIYWVSNHDIVQLFTGSIWHGS